MRQKILRAQRRIVPEALLQGILVLHSLVVTQQCPDALADLLVRLPRLPVLDRELFTGHRAHSFRGCLIRPITPSRSKGRASLGVSSTSPVVSTGMSLPLPALFTAPGDSEPAGK